MKRLSLNIFLILFLLWSCFHSEHSEQFENKKTDSNVTLEQNEIQLISQTFFQLIHPPPLPPPPPEETLTKKEIEDYNKLSKEYQRRIDTTQFTVFLYDTLIIPEKKYIDHLADTSYSELGRILLSDTLSEKKIDLNKIKNSSSFRLLREKPIFKNWSDKEFEFIGFSKYSRIIFNEDGTKALFYFEFVCGGLCGIGSLIYAEKVNEHWTIIQQEGLWVS